MSVLASDLILSPLLPELLSTRELLRGTLSLYANLNTYTAFGLKLPPIKAVANRVDITLTSSMNLTLIIYLASIRQHRLSRFSEFHRLKTLRKSATIPSVHYLATFR